MNNGGEAIFSDLRYYTPFASLVLSKADRECPPYRVAIGRLFLQTIKADGKKLSHGICYHSRYSRKRRKATTIVERGEIGNLTIEDYTLGLIEAGARCAPYKGRDRERDLYRTPCSVA